MIHRQRIVPVESPTKTKGTRATQFAVTCVRWYNRNCTTLTIQDMKQAVNLSGTCHCRSAPPKVRRFPPVIWIAFSKQLKPKMSS